MFPYGLGYDTYEKYDKMCEDEDNGVRPNHRPREWKEKERRLEKEAKVTNWHKSKPDQVSAPLILDPTGGSLKKYHPLDECVAPLSFAI